MISENIKSKLAGGSAIRKMFEEGNRLKSIYGEDKVFDFSIGNPDLEPPHEVAEALVDLAVNPVPGMHGYMSNSGYESTRSIIAKKRSDESGVAVTADAICMTVGAAAAMNDVLHLECWEFIGKIVPFKFFRHISKGTVVSEQTTVSKPV